MTKSIISSLLNSKYRCGKTIYNLNIITELFNPSITPLGNIYFSDNLNLLVDIRTEIQRNLFIISFEVPTNNN